MPPEQFTPLFLTCFTPPMSVLWLNSLDATGNPDLAAALQRQSPKAALHRIADSDAAFAGLDTLCGKALAERGLPRAALLDRVIREMSKFRVTATPPLI